FLFDFFVYFFDFFCLFFKIFCQKILYINNFISKLYCVCLGVIRGRRAAGAFLVSAAAVMMIFLFCF
ncbi:hypothetical protein MM808_31960, partial [Klebsiella pneumoniae]|nr:hypothetical protein [Klebsiella pneumoniae]